MEGEKSPKPVLNPTRTHHSILQSHTQTKCFLKLGRVTLNTHADFFLLPFQKDSIATTYRILYYTTHQCYTVLHTNILQMTWIWYPKYTFYIGLKHGRYGFERDTEPKSPEHQDNYISLDFKGLWFPYHQGSKL